MKKGILCCIFASVLFGVAPSVQNYLLLQGMEKTSCIVLYTATMLLGTLAICKIKGYSLRLPVRDAVRICVVGVLGIGVTHFLLVSSYAYISVGMATVIHFLYPTVVTIASILLFRKKGTLLTGAAVVLSIAGMALLSLSGGVGGGHLTGYVFALCSSFTYSAYIIGNERFCPQNVPLPVTLTYMAGASTVLFFVQSMLTGGIHLPETPALWGIQLFYGVVMSSAYALLNTGISKVGAVTASFSTLVEPVTSVICSVIFYHDTLTWMSLLGFVMIFASVYLNSAAPQEKQTASH